MTKSFSKAIEVNSEEKTIDFVVTFCKGGFAYEFWGAKGFHSEMEISDINFEKQGLTDLDIRHINLLIENGELDEDCYNTLD